ncbi:MAG TPA: hypothetical protein VF659_03965 [Pyrinomonadaceae bacterium]|jgi:hypothetical protein
MTNATEPREREPVEDAAARGDADPLFPSEGTFSTVVPLSQVGRAPLPPARRAAAPSEAAPEVTGDEETLVPTRGRRVARPARATAAGGGGRHWLTLTAAVVLSVVAGVAAGAYMVWSSQPTEARLPEAPAAVAPPSVTAESPRPEPPASAPAPTPAPEVASAGDAAVKPEREEAPAPEPKAAPPAATAGARTNAAEPAPRRAVEVVPVAARRERAKEEASAPAPAPKPARREAAPRRDTPPARTRPPATAANGRALPVSSPPPSSKSRTVIQWP